MSVTRYNKPNGWTESPHWRWMSRADKRRMKRAGKAWHMRLAMKEFFAYQQEEVLLEEGDREDIIYWDEYLNPTEDDDWDYYDDYGIDDDPFHRDDWDYEPDYSFLRDERVSQGYDLQHDWDEEAVCRKCGFDGAEWWHWRHHTYEGKASNDRQPGCIYQGPPQTLGAILRSYGRQA